ncbi:hypothetical protein SDC9_163102 [bioreactor metagenome]|uniref:Uncharacterized protein n=1 Tax=bioreactor metagenome TaxID=1076179 RepID=A0A645FPY9_9ZZZZ
MFGFGCSAIGKHLGPERQEELGSLEPDAPAADDAHRLAPDFASHQAGTGQALAHRLVPLPDLPEQRKGKADDQLGDSTVGVAGAVEYLDSLLLARLQPHMVDAGKGNSDHGEVFTRFNDTVRIGGVGDHDNMLAFRATDELFGICCLGRIIGEGMPKRFHLPGKLLDQGDINPQRLQQTDIHTVSSSYGAAIVVYGAS